MVGPCLLSDSPIWKTPPSGGRTFCIDFVVNKYFALQLSFKNISHVLEVTVVVVKINLIGVHSNLLTYLLTIHKLA